MPTVGITKILLDKHLGKVYTEKEFEELCFEYGLELDEVTSEKAAAEKEKALSSNESATLKDLELYKIDIPANRYDILCVEGLSRAIRIFKKEIKHPEYKFAEPKSGKYEQIIVKKETSTVRPFVVGAVLRDIHFDDDSYKSFIDLQDKLHQNICRKRTLVAIGTHDLDTIQGPFEYRAERPGDIKFKPLNQTKEYTATELMTLYGTDSHLKAYLPIIQDKEFYPVIYDSKGVVCSMPPIINGEHSKITKNTKNVFIEATATDLQKAIVVLDTVVTMFSQYCKIPFTLVVKVYIRQFYRAESVEVIYEADGRKEKYPKLSYHEMVVNTKNINTKIGFNLEAKTMADLLTKMSLDAEVVDETTLKVRIPPTRHDILHETDIAEDIGIAYGFNNLVTRLPESNTVASMFPLNRLSDLVRLEVAMAGWTEALSFALCNDISTNLRKIDGLKDAVQIANPKTLEFQVARTSLLPGLLKTLSSNRDMPLPLKLFELQDVILKDPSIDVGARNERRLGAVFYNKNAGFEIIHGFLDRIMRILNVNPGKKNEKNGYYIEKADDETYFNGRCASIIGPNNIKLGSMGVLHPEVITAFGLTLPCCAIEINLEPFV